MAQTLVNQLGLSLTSRPISFTEEAIDILLGVRTDAIVTTEGSNSFWGVMTKILHCLLIAFAELSSTFIQRANELRSEIEMDL